MKTAPAKKVKFPPIALVVWRDAAQVEAAAADTPLDPTLAVLAEVGFLLHEDDHVVVLGMEAGAADCAPGRWRLNIPKQAIVEMRLLAASGRRTK